MTTEARVIKRYDDVPHDAYANYDMEEAKDGYWVKYEDHKAEVMKIADTLMAELCKVTTCRLEPLIKMARGPGKSETVARIFNELLEEIEKS